MKPISLPYKVLIYSILAYLAILLLSYFYGSIFFAMPKAAVTATSLYTERVVYGSQNSTIAIVIGELVAGFALIIIEIKTGFFTKTLGRLANWLNKNKPIAVAILLGMFFIGIAYSPLLWLTGLAIILGLLIGLWYLLSLFKPNKIIVFSYAFLAFALSGLLFYEIQEYLLIPIAAFSLVVIYLLRKDKKLASNLFCLYFSLAYAIFLGVSFPPILLGLMLLVASVYDYLAVFVFSTMQPLAQAAMKNDMPAVFRFGNNEQLEKKIAEISKGKPPERKQGQKIESMLLGGGDIILGGVLIASYAFKHSVLAFFALTGACIGMFLNMWLLSSQRFKLGIPALPLLASSTFICIAIGILLTGIKIKMMA